MFVGVLDTPLTFLVTIFDCFPCFRAVQIVDNKAKRWISKRELQENRTRQIFEKANISYACAYSFFETFDVLCFLEASILGISLSAYYQRYCHNGNNAFTHINPFDPCVAFHIETNHLLCSAIQIETSHLFCFTFHKETSHFFCSAFQIEPIICFGLRFIKEQVICLALENKWPIYKCNATLG